MRRTFPLHYRMPTLRLSLAIQVLGPLLLWLPCLSDSSQAQAPPITPSGLNTEIILSTTPPAGKVQYDITGGTRPGGGANLFHSFGDFTVPTNNIANFLNTGSVDLNGNVLAPNLPTSNILGRVTEGDPSVIFGMIQTNGPNGFGNANLFLINPHGFLFGPNATLNVGGMVAFTAADYLRLEGVGGNGIFYADTTQTSVLTSVPVAAFGFMGLNPVAIAVQGSTLRVAPSQSISLVGGNSGFEYTDPDTGLTASTSVPGGVTMTGGKLIALGGQINLASVASPGAVSAVDFMPTAGMTMGSISLSQGALLDVSADAAGMVRIRGGEFVIDNATISADTTDADGAQTAIDINVTGDMSMSNDLAPALTAKTTGDGTAGAINITSGNLEAITSSSDNLLALIDTHTSGTGTAGNVTIDAGDLHAINAAYFIDSGSAGPGHGGDVSISGTNVHMQESSIATGDARFGQRQGQEVTGSAGNLTITASDSLKIETATITTEAFLARAGNLTLEAGDIHITGNSFVSVDGDLGGATITVDADRLTIDTASQLNSNTVAEPGGDITVTARVVDLSNGGFIQTSTLGDGPAGNLHITAMERVTLDDRGNAITRPSGLLSNSFGDFGSFGNSGAINVTTPRLEILGGAQMNTSTRSSGRAGDMTITAQSIFISGERPFESPGTFVELGSTRASGIYTRTVGSEFCAGPCGGAGNVTITTGSLNLESGGTINSGTINSGAGGNITMNAVNAITMFGTMIDGTPSGIFSRTVGTVPESGDGGNISLTAGQSVTLNNGSSVSASSTGTGDAGKITIDAGNAFEARNSSVTTKSEKAGGGDIEILALDQIRLVNSQINASAFLDGGNINIDPNVVVLQNSQILAQAIQGNGGNITIFTPLFLADQSSLVSASSQFGLNGTVTIQSPASNLSGSLGPLSSTPSQAQNLVTQRCAALANSQASSFVVAGREQLPADPGSWLTSSLALAELGESLNTGNAVASAPTVMTMAAKDSGKVSLRRLTPAGFLIANFADSEATGCHS